MNNKKGKLGKLIYLYMCLIFQKTTIFILLISFILMSLGLVLFSNPSLKQADYIMAINEIHNLYFNQGILLIQIFNIIMVITVVIVINISSSPFDIFFIPHTSRRVVCLAKVIAIVLFSILISMLEVILLFSIAFFRFNRLIINKEMYISYLNIFLALIFDSLFSLCATTLISSIFIPMLILFVSVIIKVIINNYTKISDFISLFYPVINVNKNNIIEMDNTLIILIWIILLYFLYISLYNIKEVSSK